MRLLFVSQYFDPETFRGNDIAYHLARNGWDVTVVTATPNYPEGRFFKGYGWFKRAVERKDGVKIIRIPVVPRGKNSIGLILNYFSYAINASLFMLGHLLRARYDICFVQQLSPVIMSWPGILFKKLTRKPLVTWMLDLWPESLQSAGGINNRLVLGMFSRFARWEYKASDLMLTSSRRFGDIIATRGADSQKVRFFPQWADVVSSDTRQHQLPELPDGFKVVFAGNVGEAQDFESVVEAAALLPDDGSVCLLIVGDGRKHKWVTEQVEERGLQRRLRLLGRYPTSAMTAFFEQADALMLSLKDDPVFRLTAPAKLSAYMSSGKPIVAMMSGDGADLIREARCGIAVEASQAKTFVDAILRLREMSPEERAALGENGKKFYQSNFEKEKSLQNLERILTDLCC